MLKAFNKSGKAESLIQIIVIHYLDPTSKILRWSSTIGRFSNFCYKEGNEIRAVAIDRKKELKYIGDDIKSIKDFPFRLLTKSFLFWEPCIDFWIVF